MDERDQDAEEGACVTRLVYISSMRYGQIMDLESRLAQATEELSRGTSDGTKRASKDWIPSAHPLRSLIGHRDKIYAVRFHPHYTVLASASVDATVKIWDWETGELERTLKAHTRAVTDCDFDSSGKLLGKLLRSSG